MPLQVRTASCFPTLNFPWIKMYSLLGTSIFCRKEQTVSCLVFFFMQEADILWAACGLTVDNLPPCSVLRCLFARLKKLLRTKTLILLRYQSTKTTFFFEITSIEIIWLHLSCFRAVRIGILAYLNISKHYNSATYHFIFIFIFWLEETFSGSLCFLFL